MQQKMKARGAGDAGALEDVRIDPLNTSMLTRSSQFPQTLTGYSVNAQLLVVATYRAEASHHG